MIAKSILGDWLVDLQHAESATLTACGALRGTELTEAMCVADTLEFASAHPLFNVIEAIKRAIVDE